MKMIRKRLHAAGGSAPLAAAHPIRGGRAPGTAPTIVFSECR